MKKRTYLFIVGLTLSCGTAVAINLSQSKESPKTMSGSQKISTEVKKNSKIASSQKKKGIAGVDYPTSDGFKLDAHSKILSRTDSGIVVEHGNHSHFIFYKDLQGTAFAYLIPAGASLNKPSSLEMKSSDFGAGHHYVFDPKDIVAEDANGYTVRHDDHFHYILKSSLGLAPATPNRPIHHQTFHRDTHYVPQNRGISGLDYATSDGFKFDGTGIVGRTKDSILVNHNGHLHPISFEDLRKSGWAAVADKFENKADKKEHNTVDKKEDDFQLKLDYLAKALNLPSTAIERIETEDGRIGLKYPHHDHSHVLMLEDIEIGKPIPDPHELEHARELEKHKIGMQTLKKMGFDDDVILDIVRTHQAETPFPSNETNPELMKKWLATVSKLDLGSRQNPLKRFGLALLPNLETLGIGFTPIDDMKPVLQFKKLKRLLMTATGVQNYDFLQYMPQLEAIDISQNQISDLSFLKPYKNLNLIAAADNNIKSLEPLAELPNLKFLVLSNNAIQDLKPLQGLEKLQEIHIENNKISDLSSLAGKKDLKVLNLSENSNVDLSTLNLPNLETLTVNNTGLKHLTFLGKNLSLSELTAAKNQIENLAGIELAKKLHFLDVQGNKISSLKIPGKQESLKFINVSDNKLQNLEGINDYQSLETLRAASNDINTLNLSEPNQQVNSLDVSHNHIPKEELTLNEKGIPVGVAQHFKAVTEGSIEGNKPVNEAPKLAEKSVDDKEDSKEVTD